MSIVRDGIQGDFRRDGAVCVRGAFSAERSRSSSAGSSATSPSRASARSSRAGPDDPGRFFEDFCNWDRIPEFEEFIRTSPAAAIAGELMGSTQVRLFHDHLLVKEPGTRQRRRGTRTSRTTTSTGPELLDVDAGRPGLPRVDARVRRRLAPSARGSCRARSWTARRSGSPREASSRAPRRRGRPRRVPDPRLGARAGRRRLLPHAHAARRRRRRPAAGGRSRCASSATTPCTRRAPGRPRRSSPGSPTSSPPGRRWTTVCSPCSGQRPDGAYAESGRGWTR